MLPTTSSSPPGRFLPAPGWRRKAYRASTPSRRATRSPRGRSPRASRCAATTRSSASPVATSTPGSTCIRTTSPSTASSATTPIGVDVKQVPKVAKPATFDGYVRADGRIATRNYIGVISTVNCSASVSKYVAAHFTEERLADVSQRRRRGGDHPQRRLRHGQQRQGHGRPAPHDRRLCPPCQLRRRRDHRSRLRGQPDGRALPGAGARRRPLAQAADHPVLGRQPQDGAGWHRGSGVDAADREPPAARTGAGGLADGGAAMRWLRRLFRHFGEPGAWRSLRPGRCPRRHGDPVGDAGDLRGRAPADPARREHRGRAES